MRRSKTYILSMLFAAMLCCTISPASAFSDQGQNGVLEYWKQDSASSQDTQQPVAAQKPKQGEPLSQDSQFSTRDMLYDKDTHKQFITVEGRGGNIFYIVIDYDAPINDKEEQYKTYFLNQVDEADLAALVEADAPVSCSCAQKCTVGAVNTGCPLCAANMTECAGKEPEPVDPKPEPEPEPEVKKPASMDGILTVALAVVLAGTGAVYFLKLKKKKPDVKGSSDLDDYDYGDEDEFEDGNAEDEEDE